MTDAKLTVFRLSGENALGELKELLYYLEPAPCVAWYDGSTGFLLGLPEALLPRPVVLTGEKPNALQVAFVQGLAESAQAPSLQYFGPFDPLTYTNSLEPTTGGFRRQLDLLWLNHPVRTLDDVKAICGAPRGDYKGVAIAEDEKPDERLAQILRDCGGSGDPSEEKEKKAVAKEKKKSPSEMTIANGVMDFLEGSVIKQGKMLWGYYDNHWRELESTDFLKRKIQELYGYGVGSKIVEGAYRTLLYWLPEPDKTVDLYRAQPHMVNFLNGTLHAIRGPNRLYRFEFRPHVKEDYVTSILPYKYDEIDKLPENDLLIMMLERLFSGASDGAERLRDLYQCYGACLFPAFPRFFMFHGKPETGKSTCAHLARLLVSPQNVCSVEPSQFNHFHMASMVNKLVNVDADIDTRLPIDDAMVKRFIDGVPVRIQRKRKDDIYAIPPGLHIFAGNGIPPTLDGASRAHDRRWTFIHFPNVQVKEDEKGDKHFWERVYEAGPLGLLRVALQGAKDLFDNNGHYSQSTSGRESRTGWQTEGDQVEQFIEAIKHSEVPYGNGRLHVDQNDKIERKILCDAFFIWSQGAGYRFNNMDASRLYSVLDEKGFRKKVVNGMRYVSGIGV